MKNKGFKIAYTISIIFVVLVSFFYTIKGFIYPYKYRNFIEHYSEEYSLDPLMVAAIIKTESGFRKEVRSNKDAVGLMQITEDTSKWAAEKMDIKDFNVESLKDPEFNIKMGCWYLDNLKEEFNGDIDLVLASYNGGRGHVQKWLKDERYSKDGENLSYIPFKETDKYIKKVKVNYNIYKFIYK
ncbi:lytic transglycosylase domain-containing protein [Clostridium algidicarnis]|uniref:Soluble lytic murein transglycosylase n=2 Tax=Clostridium algidicarnis TaxID=37659 RepID=A0A2S6FWR9_9CLOT|nr:lytic transglycosylase domain-containing protein [Clostridium algidicarnis]MBB6630588.1 lytic transglycosylase domain-containing protein [Clostridium algidicarnis]MBB6697419.1 lytic transglycosylase domain-containing protein [Clostridium algidicarnis]MBU3194554.1 lytic transglycosylase domain-containing protein [Clostridium algidicarnis]MBU3202686.1 lytic transglycosylase domain-containing protein [Clostridium algidicarnis]MBU3206843.1 lytic transglycosylase domain-containing protein [Clost